MSIRDLFQGAIFTLPALSTAQDGDALVYDDATKSVVWSGSGPTPGGGDVIGTANQIVATPQDQDVVLSLAPVIELGTGAGMVTLDSTSGAVACDSLQVNSIHVGLQTGGYLMPETAGAEGQYLGLTQAGIVGWLNGAAPGTGVVESIDAGLNIEVTGTAAVPIISVDPSPAFQALTLGSGQTTYTFPAERAEADNMSLVCNADGTMVFATIGGGGGSTIDSIVPVANETTAATVNNICTVGLADSVVVKDNLSVGNVLTVGADNLATKYSLPQTNGQDGQVLACHTDQTCTWISVQGGGSGIAAVEGTAGQVAVDTVEGTAQVSLEDAVTVAQSLSVGTNVILSGQTLRIGADSQLPYSLPIQAPANANTPYSLQKDSQGALTWTSASAGDSVIGTQDQIVVSQVNNQKQISLAPQVVLPGTNPSISVVDTSDNSKVVINSSTIAIWVNGTQFYQLPYTAPQIGQIMAAVSSNQLSWINGGSSFNYVDTASGLFYFGTGTTPAVNYIFTSAGTYSKCIQFKPASFSRSQWSDGGSPSRVLYSAQTQYPNVAYAPRVANSQQRMGEMLMSVYDAGGVFASQYKCDVVLVDADQQAFTIKICINDLDQSHFFMYPLMYSFGQNLDYSSTGDVAFTFTYV